MIEKKSVSQCISADYCRGYNDAVDEIVRCKDCLYARKSYNFKGIGVLLCRRDEQPRYSDDYCSFGVRKDEE